MPAKVNMHEKSNRAEPRLEAWVILGPPYAILNPGRTCGPGVFVSAEIATLQGFPSIAPLPPRLTETRRPWTSDAGLCLENPVHCRSRRKEAQISEFAQHFSVN